MFGYLRVGIRNQNKRYGNNDKTIWEIILYFHVQFRKILPSAPLSNYISCFWLIEDCYNNVLDISFPDGCIELVFSVGLEVDRTELNGSKRPGHWAEIIGQLTRPYQIRVNGTGKVFGVRFYPHTFGHFFPEVISELNDHSVQASYLLGNGIDTVVENCLHENRITDAINIIQQNLIKKLKNNKTADGTSNKIIGHAVTCILKNTPTADLHTIAQECGISIRTLQRKFRESVGVSPKHFARIMRFQQSLFYLQKGSESITTISYNLGFFDQAHFIHEFKTFSGLTPSGFQVDRHPVNRHFIPGDKNFA